MRVLVFLCLAMALSGCAQHNFKWTSDAGKKCYYTCKSNHSVCRSKCHGFACLSECRDSQYYCMQACPDLNEVAPPEEVAAAPAIEKKAGARIDPVSGMMVLD